MGFSSVESTYYGRPVAGVVGARLTVAAAILFPARRVVGFDPG
jgi:hypothetical protein